MPKTEDLHVNFLQFIDVDEMCGGKGEEVALSSLKAGNLENLSSNLKNSNNSIDTVTTSRNLTRDICN